MYPRLLAVAVEQVDTVCQLQRCLLLIGDDTQLCPSAHSRDGVTVQAITCIIIPQICSKTLQFALKEKEKFINFLGSLNTIYSKKDKARIFLQFCSRLQKTPRFSSHVLENISRHGFSHNLLRNFLIKTKSFLKSASELPKLIIFLRKCL